MKLQYVKMFASVAVFTMATTASLLANAAPSGIDNEFHKIQIVNPNDYPRMTDKEIGHVRHIARISRNPSGDWSGFDSIYMPLQGEKMFVISFMAYTLELAQHELTPAYHEIYKTSIENLLKKMQHPDVWYSWMFESRHGSVEEIKGEPMDWMTNPGWIDPILKDNIQFKAYLQQIAAAYQMLYNDKRYEQPGAFTFKWTGGMSNGQMNFRYTLTDITKNIYQEMVDSNFVGSACEPGRVFWICNAPSNAGFILYDHLYGTHYGDAGPKMNAKWINDGYRDPKTRTGVMFVSTSLQNPATNVETRTPMLDIAGSEEGGWAAVYNVAWDFDYSRTQYMAHRDKELDDVLTGRLFKVQGQQDTSSALAAKLDMKTPDEVAGRMAVRSFQMGFFTAYAAEMSDRETKSKLLAYAEKNFKPRWENGEYWFPRNDDYAVDEHGNVHGVDVWAGSALLPMARMDRGGGLHRLYTEQWGEAEYKQPYISDVDTLTAGVSQAFFDAKKDALIVTLIPGPIKTKETSFVVRQLNPKKTYTVIKDGQPVGELSPKHAPESTAWREDDTVRVATTISAPHTFVLVANW
jgi:hypothetical protein